MEISTKNNIVVYAHKYKNKIFYIGKGSCYRPLEPSGRNKIWKNFVKKIGSYHVIILKRFKNEKDAVEFEKKKIKELKPSCNIRCCKVCCKKNIKKPIGKLFAIRLPLEIIKQLNMVSIKLFNESNISLVIRYALKKFIEEHLNKDD